MDRTIYRYRSDHDLTQCGEFNGDSFCSQWYRGLRPGMEWMRLSLDAGTHVRIRVFSCDSPDEEPDVPAMERDGGDLLLYGVYGQFLRFSVTPGAALLGYELSFPGLSIDAGLPAVMQGDSTLRRLLGVCQSLYMDTNRALSSFTDRLDPLSEDAIPGLDAWLGASRWFRRDEAAMRKLLASAPMLNRMRGTPSGLKLLLELLTGHSCQLVEAFRWKDQKLSADEREMCAALYGRNAADAAVLLPAGLPGDLLMVLEDVIGDYIPLGVRWTLLTLEDSAVMDENGSMDVNASLTEPPPSLVDEAELGTLELE